MVGNRILIKKEEGAGKQGKSPSKPPAAKEFGKKPEPDTQGKYPWLPLLPGSFSDTYPEATDEDFKGRCNCWGDNDIYVPKKEQDKSLLPLGKAPYDLGN